MVMMSKKSLHLRASARILIVDDASYVQQILTSILAQNGFPHIACASNGIEALSACENFKPHLIIMDLMMPEMDGFECCKRLRETYNHAELPIIVQTSATDSTARLRAFKAGASDFLSKPVQEEELLLRCDIHLEHRDLYFRLHHLRARIMDETAEFSRMMETINPAALPPQTLEALKEHHHVLSDIITSS